MSRHRLIAQMMRAAAPPVDGIITDGLVHRWALDEGAGTDIYDSAGGLNGTIINAGGNWTADGLTLNGSNQYIDITNQTILTAGNPWSICYWWKLAERIGEYKAQICLMTDTGDPIVTMYSSNHYGDVWVGEAHEIRVDPLRLDPVPTGRWVFTVLTLDGLTGLLADEGIYVDSTSRTIVDGPPAANWTNQNSIGGIGAVNYFKGSLEDMRVYNRILSQVEIDSIFARTG